MAWCNGMGFLFGKKKSSYGGTKRKKLTPEEQAKEAELEWEIKKQWPYKMDYTARMPESKDDPEVKELTNSLQLFYYFSLKHFLTTNCAADGINFAARDVLIRRYIDAMSRKNNLFLCPEDKNKPYPKIRPGKEASFNDEVYPDWELFEFRDSTGFLYHAYNPAKKTDFDIRYFVEVLLPLMVERGIESKEYYDSVLNSDYLRDRQIFEKGASIHDWRMLISQFSRYGESCFCGKASVMANCYGMNAKLDKYTFACAHTYSTISLAYILKQSAENLPPERYTEIDNNSFYDVNGKLLFSKKDYRSDERLLTLPSDLCAKCLPIPEEEKDMPVSPARTVVFYFKTNPEYWSCKVKVGAPIEEYEKAAEVVAKMGDCSNFGGPLYNSFLNLDTLTTCYIGSNMPSLREQEINNRKLIKMKEADELTQKARELMSEIENEEY